MRDVEQWLDGLGLRQYARTFIENGVDRRALRHLTEQDLRDLGVLLGHRRILPPNRALSLRTKPSAVN